MQILRGLRGARAETLMREDAIARFADAERVRLLPDRDAPAAKLVALAQALRAAGVAELVIVTERGME